MVRMFIYERNPKLVEYFDSDRDAGYFIRSEVKDWFTTQNLDHVYANREFDVNQGRGGWSVVFDNPRDAMMFKLTWG